MNVDDLNQKIIEEVLFNKNALRFGLDRQRRYAFDDGTIKEVHEASVFELREFLIEDDQLSVSLYLIGAEKGTVRLALEDFFDHFGDGARRFYWKVYEDVRLEDSDLVSRYAEVASAGMFS